MSVVQSPIDGRDSPSFAPNNPFASNNPFRNRVSASSPDLPSPSVRQSRNPFLDVFGDDDQDIFISEGDGRPTTNQTKANPSNQPQTRQKAKGNTTDLLINLSIDDSIPEKQIPQQQQQQKQPPRRPSPNTSGPRGPQQRPTNGLPRPGRMPPPPPHHSHTKSSESSGAKPLFSPNTGSRPSQRGRDDDKSGPSRQRSNSESSAMGVVDRERDKEKRRERTKRDGDEKGKDEKSKKSSERRKRGAPLDIIDKLDVTGIYGGGLFHHDGPFDACNPHRNKNKNRAPMQAFPEGSKNNMLGGFDFDLKSVDHSHVFGNRDPEAYLDFAAGRRGSAADAFHDAVRPNSKRAQSFDPINRPIVHGDESLGLGTSTFLEGAPAAKKAIEKAQAEDDTLRPTTSGGYKDNGNLQRKKSLAQKFRAISTPKATFGDGTDKVAPGFDRRHKPTKSNSPTDDGYPEPPFSPASPPNAPSAINRSTKPTASQARDGSGDDYDTAWDKKGESIQNAEEERRFNTDKAPSSPKKPHPGVGRTMSDDKVYTSGGTSQTEQQTAASGSGGGLLKRVKSMSKGKKRDAS